MVSSDEEVKCNIQFLTEVIYQSQKQVKQYYRYGKSMEVRDDMRSMCKYLSSKSSHSCYSTT